MDIPSSRFFGPGRFRIPKTWFFEHETRIRPPGAERSTALPSLNALAPERGPELSIVRKATSDSDAAANLNAHIAQLLKHLPGTQQLGQGSFEFKDETTWPEVRILLPIAGGLAQRHVLRIQHGIQTHFVLGHAPAHTDHPDVAALLEILRQWKP